MKKGYLLLIALLLTGFVTQAQVACPGANQVMVQNADTNTTTSSYFPGYCLYNYSYNQVIIPAERLTGMGTIQAMQFNPTNTTGSSYYTNCEVYLALTAEEDLSAGWSTETAGAELVWSGDMSFTSAGWQTIVFDDAFSYDGVSNLLVIVVRNHGAWTSSTAFAAFTATAQLGRYAYTDGSPYTLTPSVTGTPTNTVGWYRFLGCDDVVAITCNRVRDIVVDDITTGGATLHWLDTANSSSVTYTIFNMADTSEIASGIADTFYTITDFSPNTVYNLAIAAVCGAGDTSAFARVSFRTACGAIESLPWTEDFNDYPTGSTSDANFIPCWNRFENGTYHYPIVSTSYARTGNALYYYNYSGSSYGSLHVLALPVIDTLLNPMQELQLKFWARSYYSYEGDIQVGVMTNYFDENSFAPLESFHISGEDYQEHCVAMGNAPAGAVCMAIKYLTLSSSTQYVIIDDVTIEHQPACPPIVNLTVEGTTTNGALLSWGYQAGTPSVPEQYNLSWQNIDDISSTPVTATTTNPWYAISGLTSGVHYRFYVVPDCGSEDGFGIGDSIEFKTAGFSCGAVDPTSTAFDTIGDINGNSSTSNYFPTNSCYNYALGQQIFTPEEIGHGGQINSIAMKVASVADANRNMEIYMTHSSDASASDFIWDGTVLVWSGTTALVADSLYTFTLNTPFLYNGVDNLVIICRDMTGSYQCSNYWYVNQNGVSGCSRYIYQDGSAYPIGFSGGSASNLRNDIIFNMSTCTQIATCATPQAMVTEVQTNEATLAWIPGADEDAWDVYYRVYGDTAWIEAASSVSTTSYTVSGLLPGTAYEFRIVNPCDQGVFEDVVRATLACAEQAPLPLTEDMQTLEFGTFNRPCWVVGTSGLGTNYPLPYVTSLQGAEDNKLCLFYNGAYMVLPRVDADLSDLQIRFKFTQGGDNVRFLMGLLPEQNSPIDSIIVLDTIIRSNIDSTMSTVNYSYSFDTINEAYNSYCVVFWDAFNDNYSFIDDLILDYPAACTPVSELTASNVTTSTVDINWNVDGDNATSYTVEYGPAWFTPGTGTTVTASGSPVTLTGLNHSTDYDVYVYTECGGLSATSVPSQVVKFTTPCDLITELPYVQTFENIMAPGSSANNVIPNCWAVEGNSLPYIYYTSSSVYTSSPTHCFYFPGFGVAAMPQLGVPIDSLMLSFHAYNSSPGSYGLIVGTVDSVTTGFAESFQPIDTVVFNSEYRVGTSYEFNINLYLNHYAGSANRLAFKSFSPAGYSYTYTYIDDVVIDRRPDCIPPQHIHTTAVTATSASLAWSVSDAPGFVAQYGVHGFTLGTGVNATTSTSDITLTGLNPDTEYDVYLWGNCGSDTVMYTFRTICNPVNLPYFENFDSITTSTAYTTYVTPGCWRYNLTSPGYDDESYAPMLYYSSAYASSGDYSLRLYGAGYTMLPEMPVSLDTLLLTFKCATTYSDYALEVGVMEGNVFVPIQPVSAGDTPTEIEVDFSAYTGTSRTIAFHNTNTYGYGYSYHYIDDVNVDYLPSCPRPVNVTSVGASTSSITIDWTERSSATQWQIEYGSEHFNQGAGTIIAATSHPVTITGLDSATAYDFYVRPICSATDTGNWSHGATLTTSICDNANIVFTGAPTGTGYYTPVNDYYNYTLTQTIIDSAELAGMSEISAIAYSYAYSEAMEVKDSVVIYLQPTDKVEFADADDFVVFDTTIAVKVYEGNLNCTQGWNYFAFDTPFTWDGHSNLVVIVDDNSHDYDGSSYKFNSSACSGYKTLSYYSDSYNPDINDPASFSGSKMRYEYRATMQLISCGPADCDAPAIVSAVATETEATITFSGESESYEVAIVEGAWVEPAAGTPVADTFYTFTGLTGNTTYAVGVRSACGSAFSDWAYQSITTERHPCVVPTGLTVSNVTLTGATLTWTVGEEGQTDFEVNVTGNNFDETFTATGTSYTVSGLNANGEYSATVRAVCDEGYYSDWSAPATFTTETCVRPSQPTAGSITANGATITWPATSNSNGSYILEYGIAGFNYGSGTSVTVNGTSYTITGLDAEYVCDVYVRSVCDEGVYSDWSPVCTFTTTSGEGTYYTVTVTVNDPAMGHVDGAPTQPVEAGTVVTLTAVANDGYHFVNWNDGQTTASITFAVNGNMTVTANFAQNSGIDDVDATSVSVYPNPASSDVTVKVGQPSEVMVIDMQGRTVVPATSVNSSLLIPHSSLPAGTYFLRITGEQTTLVRKLIVQ